MLIDRTPNPTAGQRAARPQRQAWLVGARKHGAMRACVCCSRDAGRDARQVLVPFGRRTRDNDFRGTLDPSDPGDDYASYAVCEQCAARLPAGHAQRVEDLATALALYGALPEVIARRAAAPAAYERALLRVA